MTDAVALTQKEILRKMQVSGSVYLFVDHHHSCSLFGAGRRISHFHLTL